KFRRLGQPLGPDHLHPRGVFADELQNLEHAHAQQGIKQQRQHGDHEQRAAIAELIAHFAVQHQLDVGPSHRSSPVAAAVRACSRSSCCEMSWKNSSSKSRWSWRSRNSSRPPSARIRPRWTIASRSQSFSASRMMCVENSTHLPCSRSSATVLSKARATSTSKPEVASSKISTGGSWTKARAIETFCFMPVDILAPKRSRISFICKRWKRCSIRPLSVSSSRPCRRPKYSTISQAVMRSYTPVLADMKPICRRTCEGCVSTSAPATVTEPPVGRKTV